MTARMQVTFKHEDLIGGQPVGPVTADDLDAADADPVVAGHAIGMPFGYKPAWRTDHGWLTLAQAEQIAAQYGVELTIY
jgi:hypothetical protein